ncbi:hypothetical protein [Chitiniphilus eburneus]|uniref:Flagellar basal-body/hook protein C-terminal domain-containing protein n=1 Tax=Chitiniphilus eburneus TaxID=2571148 RepID=A0A4U0PCF8_9NEIS|nr:hypothetical protein [Chitiniphilus eburneus]TJZ65437.1 hypothetical protein FAZ21_18200 [Chitiniphilus eburneus]
MSISTFGIGLAGMQTYQRALDVSAARVASAGLRDDTEGLTRGLVGTTEAKDNFQAAAKVVKAADGMIGTLLDTLA